MAEDVADHELPPRAHGGLHDPLGARHCFGERLLDEHVRARFHRLDGVIGMRVGEGVDRDDVRPQLGERLLVVRIALSRRPAPRGAPVRRCCACRRRRPRSPGCACRRARGTCPCCRARQPIPASSSCAPPTDVGLRHHDPVFRRPSQRSSSVSSRAMTMLPAVSPQSTGSTTPVIAEAGRRRETRPRA